MSETETSQSRNVVDSKTRPSQSDCETSLNLELTTPKELFTITDILIFINKAGILSPAQTKADHLLRLGLPLLLCLTW